VAEDETMAAGAARVCSVADGGALIGAASRGKNPINQDAAGTLSGRHGSLLVVADGLGTSFDAQVASAAAVGVCIETFQAHDRFGAGKWPAAEAYDSVGRLLSSDWRRGLSSRYLGVDGPLRTTLVTAVDAGDEYDLAYVGNGSALMVRGDFWSFGPRHWPWCVTELLSVHSVLDPATGRDTLSRVVGPRYDAPPPARVTRGKDRTFGEILFVCSDGVASSEQLKTGSDSSGRLWLEVNPHVVRLIRDYLPAFLSAVAGGTAAQPALDQMLGTFLAEGVFDDDATIGAIVAPRAIEYFLEVGGRGAS
jgi:serine/threonine protein phosphatase PrpC